MANNLPVKEAKFNSIVLSDVLEHIPQPDVLWKEMHRILEKGGRIFLNVPFYYRLHEIPYDFYRYTEYALHRLAEFQGFKIIFLESIGGLPEIMADLFSKAVNNIPMLGRYLSVAIQNLTIVFLKTKLGHNISLKTKKIFPLGYFMIVEKI